MRPLPQLKSEVSILSMQPRISHLLGPIRYFKPVIAIKTGIYAHEVA